MANAITRTVLLNGSKEYVVLFNIVFDGATAETGTIVNKTTGDMGLTGKVVKLIADFPVQGVLLFDATTDVVFQGIPTNTHVVIDYRDIGGIPNPLATGNTGDILLSTIGNGTAGQCGTILLHVQKS